MKYIVHLEPFIEVFIEVLVEFVKYARVCEPESIFVDLDCT